VVTRTCGRPRLRAGDYGTPAVFPTGKSAAIFHYPTRQCICLFRPPRWRKSGGTVLCATIGCVESVIYRRAAQKGLAARATPVLVSSARSTRVGSR
ncbi:hypothetical protein X777_09571, partial [Ooceraea biroi]